MEAYKLQIIESVVSIIILIIISKFTQRLIHRAGLRFSYHKTRIQIVKKVANFVLYTLFIGILLLVWGIAPTQLAAAIGSLFTVVGIAFLAQWSLISNITSTLIIFFNHQVSIGDNIVIMDKEYSIEGTVYDIGIFFIIIQIEKNELVSIPSNVFMQKMVKKVTRVSEPEINSNNTSLD